MQLKKLEEYEVLTIPPPEATSDLEPPLIVMDRVSEEALAALKVPPVLIRRRGYKAQGPYTAQFSPPKVDKIMIYVNVSVCLSEICQNFDKTGIFSIWSLIGPLKVVQLF